LEAEIVDGSEMTDDKWRKKSELQNPKTSTLLGLRRLAFGCVLSVSGFGGLGLCFE
jgi:hypothetical protein